MIWHLPTINLIGRVVTASANWWQTTYPAARRSLLRSLRLLQLLAIAGMVCLLLALPAALALAASRGVGR